MSDRPLELFRRLTNGLYVVGVADGETEGRLYRGVDHQVSFNPLLVALSVNPRMPHIPFWLRREPLQ